MAVDAHHLLLSPPQLFSNRELTMNNNNTTTSMEQTNGGFFTYNQTGYGAVSVSPFSVIDESSLFNFYGCSSAVDTIPTTTAADSFAYGANVHYDDFLSINTRKRSRDDTYHQNQRSSCVSSSSSPSSPFSFLGQDINISSHINQQHREIDRFVSLHMERVKLEIQEKRKEQAKTIMEAIENGLLKRLRVKEEEKERIGKVNHALEERVKTLSLENQIWRDLAQSNEAAANNLRANLEQVLAQVKDIRGGAGLDNVNGNGDDDDDDAESCCGSSSGEETVRRRNVAKEAHDRMCRNCGEEESCVLLLPCRHLCLCGACGSSVHTCPICRSPKNASVHVNMSP
ncbi:unnamed protein product [Cochlearia groenlandica]